MTHTIAERGGIVDCNSSIGLDVDVPDTCQFAGDVTGVAHLKVVNDPRGDRYRITIYASDGSNVNEIQDGQTDRAEGRRGRECGNDDHRCDSDREPSVHD